MCVAARVGAEYGMTWTTRGICFLGLRVIVCWLSASWGTAHAQSHEPSIVSWTQRDGLPPAHIHAITQDADGYIWLGTGAGLVRFDGAMFQAWTPPPGTFLPATAVSALATSRDGSLWMGFGQNGGIVRLQEGKATTYSPPHAIPPGVMNVLFEDSRETIWAGGQGVLARFVRGSWRVFGPADGFQDHFQVTSIHEDAPGHVSIAGTFGRLRVGEEHKIEVVSTEPTTVSVAQRNGVLWTDEGGRLTARPPGRSACARASGQLQTIRPSRIVIDRIDRIWVAIRGGGFIRIDETPAGGCRTRRFSREDGIDNDYVSSLFEDRDGNVWVGSVGVLERVSFERAPVHMTREFTNVTVRSVATGADGTVWVGTNRGLARISRAAVKWYTVQDGLPGPAVTSVAVDSALNVWVGTGHGLARLVGNRLVTSPSITNGIDGITAGPDGHVWVLDSRGGLHRFSGDRSVHISDYRDETLKRASVIFADSSGRLWIGFATGGVATIFDGTFDLTSPVGLVSGHVNSISEDSSRRIWISTQEGASRLDGSRVLTLSARNGIPGTGAINGAVEDGRRRIWFGSNGGIVGVDHDEVRALEENADYKPRYVLLDASHRLSGSTIWGYLPSSARSTDGTLWFVTTNGLASFDERHAFSRPPVPRITVEGMTVDSKQVALTSPIVIAPNASRVEIAYSAIVPPFSTHIRFHYKLEGYDNTWIDAGLSRQVAFTNLSPRSYTFLVKAHVLGSDSGAVQTALPFSIAPAFHERRSTQAGFAACVACGVWFTWKLKRRHALAQRLRVATERARLSRELHDTLLQGMAGTTLHLGFIAQALRLSSHNMVAQEVDEACGRLKSYMDETRLMIWDLRSEWLIAGDFSQSVNQVTHRICGGTGTKVNLSVAGNARSATPFTEEQTLKILHEAVANSVKHGRCESVDVALQYLPHDLVLRVTSTGPRRSADAATADIGARAGLIGMRERAEQIGATLRIDETGQFGSEVLVVVPWKDVGT